MFLQWQFGYGLASSQLGNYLQEPVVQEVEITLLVESSVRL